MANRTTPKQLSKHVATVRIIFGLMWAVDAAFKWQSNFRNGFLDLIKGAADGQPSWLHGWYNFWIKLLAHNPHLFAVLIAIIESLVALALILGLARRLTYISAAVYSIMIWAVAEGFGGPYSSASTDIGTGIVYALVFFSLYGLDRLVQRSSWSIDNLIVKRLPWWAIIANP